MVQSGLLAGLGLVVQLGADPKVGGSLDLGYRGVLVTSGPVDTAGDAMLHLVGFWPVVTAEVTLDGGSVLPAASHDRGYLPLVGLSAGGGLSLATDGTFGPVVQAELYGPIVGARLGTTFTDGSWRAPRLGVGAAWDFLCCSDEEVFF